MKYAIAARTAIPPSAMNSASVPLMLPPELLEVVTTGATGWVWVGVGAEDWGRPMPKAPWAALDGEPAASAATGDSDARQIPRSSASAERRSTAIMGQTVAGATGIIG